MSGRDGQGGEEAEHHGRHAGEDLEDRLGDGAEARRGVLGHVDRREQADRAGDQHGDQRDQHGADEQRHGAEGAGLADLVRAHRGLRRPLQCRTGSRTRDSLPKKRSVSNSTEKTMPTVVSTATAEQAMQHDLDDALERGCGRGSRGASARSPGQARPSAGEAGRDRAAPSCSSLRQRLHRRRRPAISGLAWLAEDAVGGRIVISRSTAARARSSAGCMSAGRRGERLRLDQRGATGAPQHEEQAASGRARPKAMNQP